MTEQATMQLANELLELAWGIIANAGGGDWDRETPEWRAAAMRWRDRYHDDYYAHRPPLPVTAAVQGAEG